jgi:uncharacterized protein
MSAALLPDPSLLYWTAAVVFVAALVSSIAGFAFSALAGAALLFLLRDPPQAVAVLLGCSIAIQAYCVWALRRDIEWRALRPFVAGGALTVPVGVWLLTRLEPFIFAVVLGAFITAYGLYMLLRASAPVVRAGWRADAFAGTLGGLAGGLAAFPGSFVTIWCGMRGWSKERQRALYQPYILLMQLEALALLHWQAPKALALEPFMLHVPAALAGAHLGLRVFRRMSNRQFALTVNTLLVVSGIALAGGAL